jgi:UDP-N-acetylglucosamine 2-epimerase (non-hydrolysing)
MSRKTVLCMFGTRPEAIKMAPVIRSLKLEPDCRVVTLCTGQHQELLQGILEWFDIEADHSLNVMEPGQSLGKLTASLLIGLERVFQEIKPDLVLGQGDTTSVMTAALACFYSHTPFGHVEAGLRTGNMQSPFPEEFNRVAVGKTAALHFCPTSLAMENLRRESVPDSLLYLTGNTVVDALQFTIKKLGPAAAPGTSDMTRILVTVHRRENFGEPLENICRAIQSICLRFPQVRITLPVHPNPNVHKTVYKILGASPQVNLVDPLSYPELVAEMNRAAFILTDSGGIQEEGPVIGKPILVLRRETERPEAISLGVAKLVGTEKESIVHHSSQLITCEKTYQQMQKGGSPYGDGKAAERIARIVSGKSYEPFKYHSPTAVLSDCLDMTQ